MINGLKNNRIYYSGLFIPLLGIVTALFSFSSLENLLNLLWGNEPIHTFIEVTGAMIAIIMAIIIRLNNQFDVSNKYETFALGFLSMGILNIFHSIIQPSDSFVFLHSIAALLGGFFFVLILFPKFEKIQISSSYFNWMLLLILLIGVLSISFPQLIPSMTSNGVFTTSAVIINYIAGFLFLLTSIKLSFNIYKDPNSELFLFLLISILFVISSFTFSSSQIWDGIWWTWHFIQLIAFIITLSIVIKDYLSNINNLKSYQSLIEKNNNDLKKKNKELSHFTYIASHDLQEPLNTILSFSGLLKEDYTDKLDGLGKQCLDIIDSTAIRMKDLVIGLLEYSRIGKNRTLELINVNNLLDEVKSDLADSITANKATIVNDDLLEIKAFPMEFRILLLNLVSNAIKYSKKSEPAYINIQVEENPTEYIYSVSDNGIGLDMKYKDKIFEVFQRLHTRDQYSGTGIGLSNCSRIVELHKGKIWVNSELNLGSTFSFTINKNLENE